MPILVAGLRLYCVRPPMWYLDLGLSVSGLGGRPLAIYATHTKAVTAVKPLIGSLSHADCGEVAGRSALVNFRDVPVNVACVDGPRLIQLGLSKVNAVGSSYSVCARVCVYGKARV